MLFESAQRTHAWTRTAKRSRVAAALILTMATFLAQSQPGRGAEKAGRPAAESAADPAAYCPALQRVLVLALSKQKFAEIAGRPREGSYVDTTLPLPGWADCSLYGSRTYTCDSVELADIGAARKAEAVILRDLKACVGPSWVEDLARSSPGYAVLRSANAPLSMTISRDQTGDAYVVRLIVFLRGGAITPE